MHSPLSRNGGDELKLFAAKDKCPSDTVESASLLCPIGHSYCPAKGFNPSRPLGCPHSPLSIPSARRLWSFSSERPPVCPAYPGGLGQPPRRQNVSARRPPRRSQRQSRGDAVPVHVGEGVRAADARHA